MVYIPRGGAADSGWRVDERGTHRILLPQINQEKCAMTKNHRTAGFMPLTGQVSIIDNLGAAPLLWAVQFWDREHVIDRHRKTARYDLGFVYS